jgi:hypothetical protein
MSHGDHATPSRPPRRADEVDVIRSRDSSTHLTACLLEWGSVITTGVVFAAKRDDLCQSRTKRYRRVGAVCRMIS